MKSQLGNDPFLSSHKLLVELFSFFFFLFFVCGEEVCSFRTKGGLLLQCCCEIKIDRRSAAYLTIYVKQESGSQSLLPCFFCFVLFLFSFCCCCCCFFFFGYREVIGPAYSQRRGMIPSIMPRGYLRILPIFYRTQARERSASYPCFWNNFGAKLHKHIKCTKDTLVNY